MSAVYIDRYLNDWQYLDYTQVLMNFFFSSFSAIFPLFLNETQFEICTLRTSRMVVFVLVTGETISFQ